MRFSIACPRLVGWFWQGAYHSFITNVLIRSKSGVGSNVEIEFSISDPALEHWCIWFETMTALSYHILSTTVFTILANSIV